MHPETSHQGFAKLRSLMNTPKLSAVSYEELWALMQWGFVQDEEMYKGEWIPYMEGFSHHWERHAFKMESVDDVTLVPFGRFSLHLETPHFLYKNDTLRVEVTQVIQALSTGYYCFALDFQDQMLHILRHAHNMKRLSVEQSLIHADFLGKMARDTAMPHLEHLALEENDAEETNVLALLNSKMCSRLQSFGLTHCREPDSVLQNLNEHDSLVTLFMPRANLTKKSCQNLAQSDLGERLTGLDFSGSAIRGKALSSLLFMANLKHLNVSRCRLTDKGMESFKRHSSRTTGLRSLDLSHNDITHKGIKHLARSKRLIGLERLVLKGIRRFNDKGLELLLRAPWFKSLKHLNLSYNILSPKQVQALVSLPDVVNLTSLELVDCDLTWEQKGELRYALGLRDITVVTDREDDEQWG